MTDTAHTTYSKVTHHPATDYYHFDALLTAEEIELRNHVRSILQQEVVPVINDYWDRGEFAFELIPVLKKLGVVGGTIQGYGCPGLTPISAGAIFTEISRADASINAFMGVSELAMYAIGLYGSEEQKQHWLPAMARLEKIGAFAATEPDHGSDLIHLQTRARREGDEWVLNGEKRWISNASFADVIVVWARTGTQQVNGFLLEKGTPGFEAHVIQQKGSLRAAWPTNITLQDVRIPIQNRLPRTVNFSDAAKVINLGRYRVAWAALGSAMACFDYALAYTKNRKQFGKPLASFQMVQSKLAHMLGEIIAMQGICYRLGQLLAAGELSPAQTSLAKMHNTLKARQVATDARDLLGGNGILLENHVMRHFADIESMHTAEGTNHVLALTVGLDLTGIQAFG